jgi:hypothetical protein
MARSTPGGMLGDLLVRQGRYAEAESLAVDALARSRSLLGQEHSHIAMLMHRIAHYRQLQGKAGHAAAGPAADSSPLPVMR